MENENKEVKLETDQLETEQLEDVNGGLYISPELPPSRFANKEQQ